MPARNNPVDIALEELKLLNAIIARLEDVEYKIRSWLFPLLTGIAVAPFYAKDINPPKWFFLTISCVLIITFMAIELLHRPPKRRAIDRAKIVEAFLRGENQTYDGPKITTSLSDTRRSTIGPEFWRMVKHGPYIPLFILVLLVYIVYINAG